MTLVGRSVRFSLLSGVASGVLVSTPVAAQTTTGTATVTSVQGNPPPLRFINGQQVSPRPQNLNPTGISFSDCIQDMTLQFSVFLTGFDGSESLQIWATRSGDCSADSARAVGGSGVAVPSCWLVGNGPTGEVISGQSATFSIRVQDIVGPQNSPPTPPSLVHEDSTACSAQPSFTAVPMDIWFVPVNSAGQLDGTAFDFPITADLVGPPPPVNVSLGIGDTLLLANWTPNIDTDTGGYDVFVDPPPGTETSPVDAADMSADAAGQVELVCPDAASSSTSVGLSDAGDSAVATAGASMNDAAGAGCFFRAIPPASTSAGACTSNNLTSGIVQDASTVTIGTTVTGDAGTDAGVVTGTGGVSTVDCRFLVGTSCPAGSPVYLASNESVSGESNGRFNIDGLVNGVLYNVAISAVDNFGNVGPPSAEVCEQPQPVNDFYKTYRDSGGQAGGGYCALEGVGMAQGSPIVGAGFVAMFGALFRRRSKSSRTASSRRS